MDTSTKRACFDEISHQICDADAKVRADAQVDLPAGRPSDYRLVPVSSNTDVLK